MDTTRTKQSNFAKQQKNTVFAFFAFLPTQHIACNLSMWAFLVHCRNSGRDAVKS